MRKSKTYREDVKTLEWLNAHIPKQQESAFIRDAVKAAIDQKKKSKKLSTVK